MNIETRTLPSVSLEDIVQSGRDLHHADGENVEARRKFIEDNALDVRNLDRLEITLRRGSASSRSVFDTQPTRELSRASVIAPSTPKPASTGVSDLHSLR